MVALRALGLCATMHAASALWSEFPAPPAQTENQQSLFKQKAAAAEQASEASTADVLEFLASADLKKELEKCCPRAAAMSAQELLEGLRRELRASELAHAFPAEAGTGIFTDMTLDAAGNLSWFLNEWQAKLMSGVPATGPQNEAETEIFGCADFANGSATWSEASDRLIYVASNMRRLDTGSLPNFGDVTAIFSTEYVKNMVLISPVDTGLLVGTCDGAMNKTMTPFKFNCDAWSPRTVGTLEHFDHLLLPHFNMMQGSSMAKEAAALIARSALGGDYARVPRIGSLKQLRYFESNVLGNPALPEGVRFLIGSFPDIFGTDAGLRLQSLAQERSWPLVWALGGRGRSQVSQFVLPETGNERLLDAEVAAKLTNASICAEMASNFWELWREVAAARGKNNSLAAWRVGVYWSKLKKTQPLIAPLGAGVCADMEACIGTFVNSGDCICSKSPSSFVV